MKADLVLTCFVNNVVTQVDIMLIVVSINNCGSYISQFLNVVENSIYWYVHIKIRLFDHILTLNKHLRCNFSIIIKDMLEDDSDGLIDEFGVAIAQGSDVLHADS